MIKKLKTRIKVVLKHREYLVELHAQWLKDMKQLQKMIGDNVDYA